MSISNGTLLVLSTFLIASCATAPSGQTFDSPIGNWTEKYENSAGKMETSRLTIDETSARYTDSFNTRVDFHASDDQRTWNGIWIHDNRSGRKCIEEKDGSTFWGEVVFQFNETYTRYTGTWDYCGEGEKKPISGVR